MAQYCGALYTCFSASCGVVAMEAHLEGIKEKLFIKISVQIKTTLLHQVQGYALGQAYVSVYYIFDNPQI
jgi:hypothetical protein